MAAAVTAIAEEAGLKAAYAEAKGLLVTAQRRLTAAADAVTRYQHAVRKFLGREPAR